MSATKTTPPQTTPPTAPNAIPRKSAGLAASAAGSYIGLFRERPTQIASVVGIALILVPGVESLIGIPGWAPGLLLLAAAIALGMLTQEPPPEQVLVERKTQAYAGNTARTNQRILRRKDFFYELGRKAEQVQRQGSLYTLVVAGLRPPQNGSVSEIYELRLECMLASHFRDTEVLIGRIGGCRYGVGLGGYSGTETHGLIGELRQELADLFSGQAKPYVGTTTVVAGDDAAAVYERALTKRRTISSNPFMRLVYWSRERVATGSAS